MSSKGTALLCFLKDAATLRRQRIPAYRTSDRVLWFSSLPKDRTECRSPFLAAELGEGPDFWLEVRKARLPIRPPVPEMVAEWVRPEDLDQPDREPELLPEITILVEQELPDPDAPPEQPRAIIEKVPQLRRLQDHPEVEEAWLEYLMHHWEPWAEKMRRWQEVHEVYEAVDFMRRRVEESEERYELFLGVGLLHWRDSTGKMVKRHLLTGPAEIEFDAARGILTVVPADSFEAFKVELDMLELADQPRLDSSRIQEQLEELDIGAWDADGVSAILREIANRAKGNAQVDEKNFEPTQTADTTFCVYLAPALVLRERRPTAFEEVVGRLLEQVANDSPTRTTGPWERFLDEGASSHVRGTLVSPAFSGAPGSTEPPGRLFFPLPTNEEQRQIVHRLRAPPCVVGKGPPGTGKSHTIANLVCHLLASGERILITAQAPKALTVLRDMLPEDLQDLCVTALGSSREDQRLLEEGVRGILRRQNEWQGTERVQAKIDKLEKQLKALEAELTETERQLRESREAETHSHHLPGGYEGTAAQIARKLEQERETLGWFPDVRHDRSPFPLQEAEVRLLAAVHAELTTDLEHELRLDIGNFVLPTPDEFRHTVTQLEEAEREAHRHQQTADPERLDHIRNSTREHLEKTAASLRTIDEHGLRATHVLGDLAAEILKDLLVDHRERWCRLQQEAVGMLREIDDLLGRIGGARVELPPDVHPGRLLVDTVRRLEYFEKGGRHGFLVLKPQVVKETRYVEERCLVDDTCPRDVERLRKLVAFLRLKALIQDFERLWPRAFDASGGDPRQAVMAARELVTELEGILTLFEELGREGIPCVPMVHRLEIAGQSERTRWLRAIEAELAVRSARAAKKPLEECLQTIRRCLEGGRAHASLEQLAEALERRDPVVWQGAWAQREMIRGKQKHLVQYDELIIKLTQLRPKLAASLREGQGDPTWQSRLLQVDKAWTWASAHGWLQDVADRERYKDLAAASHRLGRRIEEQIEEIASLRAWQAFFDRLDDATIQRMRAWTRAVDRIGKGTGKYAYRHRRTARGYLMACIPKIPAWVLPLHKLWDTVDAEPGLFDTVIIDEASQAEIDSLALFLLAKRVIVVGDDKQNSPEDVGIREDDIARLAREHLMDFRFREEFRPNASLFDHAERAFGNLISLREHFRCVPEIIRFSNDLCYRDAPLIPLRQAPPERLPPLRHTYVRGGRCDGDGQRVHNRAEAEILVQTIRACFEDEAYDGKTMGVIVLQGHAQAELIARMLAAELDPQVIEERKLRCGVPATFQGDQRDVIFLSLVIAPHVQFRALNRLPDQRRFNVAMSRARDQVWLFHSVQLDDLSPEDLRRRLLSFVQSPWHDASARLREEHERLEREALRSRRRLGEQPEPYESWFEVDVALELLRQNYRIHPQYEVARKRIDLVVEGIENRLAVECDGDAWHGPEHYEQDMARQRQLERAGWTFVRVREAEFYSDRARVIDEIVQACGELSIRPVDRPQQVTQQGTSGEMEVELVLPTEEVQSPDDAIEVQTDTLEDLPTTEQGPFTGYSSALDFPDPLDASPANVRAGLRNIIEKDGPISRASVYRLYVEGCPHRERATKVVRQALNHALGTMLRSGEIVQEDELGDGSPEGQVLRVAESPRVRERPAGRRDLQEIPPSELFVVLERLASGSLGTELDDEALLRGLLEYYGYSRLTANRRGYLRRILELYRSNRRSNDLGDVAIERKA